MTLGQTAFQLAEGRLWIEGMAEGNIPAIPCVTIGDVCSRIGPHDLDITGGQVKGDGLPQGPFKLLSGAGPGDAYPALWNHYADKERYLIVPPDSHGQIREVSGSTPMVLRERAEARWATASRAHYNRDLQFNSQSLIVATTEQPSLGGRAWPSVVFADPDRDLLFALWCNSTLGLLCHWWMSNKSQAGRGSVTVTSIPLIPTLDLRTLSDKQIAVAKDAFDALSDQRLLPFDQADEDPARAELDRRLLVDVLGLDKSLCDAGGPIELLRKKLSAEPQIHSNKRSRVVFTQDGEKSVRRTE